MGIPRRHKDLRHRCNFLIPHGRPVEGHAPSPLGASRVALISLYRHAVVITPVARWVGSLVRQRIPAVYIARQRLRPSPPSCRVGVHIGRFEACSTFTRVTACLLAAWPKPRVSLEGSDGFVTSTAAPIATGWSDPVARWELHPLKTNTFSRRTTRCPFRKSFTSLEAVSLYTVTIGTGGGLVKRTSRSDPKFPRGCKSFCAAPLHP